MSLAADSPDSPSGTSTENNFQPFFVLHKALPPRKPLAKTRRKIDTSPNLLEPSSEQYNDNLRFETFKSRWSNTESAIKESLRNINTEVFDTINKWIHDSFEEIHACRKLDSNRSTLPYPIVSDASITTAAASRQIFTALLFTKNMEFVDDILTYVDLGEHLRRSGSHVASLTSLEFTAKTGVGGCLRALVRQFLSVNVDAPDMSVLASWYVEQGDTAKPMVVIIDDVERCCSPVLADFIVLLREWCIKVPIILILGVATTVDALRNILPSNTCSYLSLCEFTFGTPAEKMTAITEAVLMKNCDNFGIGKQVSAFLRNYFLRHDGTITFFTRALKIAMLQHVYTEPISCVLSNIGDKCAKPSASDDLACDLSNLSRLRKIWSSIVMCLYEVGKYHNITLLDIYCDMLEPPLCSSKASNHNQLAKDDTSISSSNSYLGCLQKGGCVYQATKIVRDLPAAELQKLLKSWEIRTRGITEIHEKVVELQSLKMSNESLSRRDVASKRSTSRNIITDVIDETKMRDRIATLVEDVVREYVQPIESVPLSDRFFFNNVSKLQAALVGDPRKRIQADLLESHKFLKCSCCSKNNGHLSPYMHDSSILYSLAQEHGDIINVHEWFHSFKAIVCDQPIQDQPIQAKKKLKLSPSPKKRKARNEPQKRSDAAIQAEFCRAVTELQITGLLRMPSKRRPDFVQRVAFGL